MHCSSFSKSPHPATAWAGWQLYRRHSGAAAQAHDHARPPRRCSRRSPNTWPVAATTGTCALRLPEQQQAIALAAVAQHFARHARVAPEGGGSMGGTARPVERAGAASPALQQGISPAPGRSSSADQRFALRAHQPLRTSGARAAGAASPPPWANWSPDLATAVPESAKVPKNYQNNSNQGMQHWRLEPFLANPWNPHPVRSPASLLPHGLPHWHRASLALG